MAEHPAPSCPATAMVGYVPEGQGRFLSPPSPTVAPSQLCPSSSPCPSGTGRQLPALLARETTPSLVFPTPCTSLVNCLVITCTRAQKA